MPADNKRMTRPDWQDFMEWMIWAGIFGGIIAATLWMLLVKPF